MSEKKYMQLALELASRGEGRTAPNPPVGAVVVRDDVVVGQGFHPRAGEPHAEIHALREAGDRAAGGTLYVTLEPCNHQGRTGPCTEAVIAAGIARVVVGCQDPNPEVSGSGIDRLREAGLEVAVGRLNEDCRRLIAPFAKHVTTGLPLVTLKMAMTLDGQTSTSTGDSRWISGEMSRQYVHRMRDRADAIMVGIGTVLADDPKLTTRHPEGGRDPLRVVVDTHLRIPETAQLLTVDSQAGTIVFTTDAADARKRERLVKIGVEVVVVPAVEERVDLQSVMLDLGRRNIQSVLLEGGATLAAEALRRRVVDRAAFFIAPMLFGGDDGSAVFSGRGCRLVKEAVRLDNVRIRQIADDILVEGEVA